MTSKTEIRRRMRRQRRALSPADRARAATRLTAMIGQLAEFRAARHVAVFIANDGEIDPAGILRRYTAKNYYLPVVPRGDRRRMGFAPLGPGTSFSKNRYGILEPEVPASSLISARQLELVLAPLVAFDRTGGRLGMGGGYYDATFDFLADRRRWHQPRMVGIAFSFQEVPHIEREHWDIPLSAVVTDIATIRVN